MTFRPRPYDPNRPRKPESEAQAAARQRAFRIFRLRGLHSLCWLLTADRRVVAQALVDQELTLLGAESETKRQADRRAALDERLEARRIHPSEPDTLEMPF